MTATETLTKKQMRVLQFIARYIAEKKYPPAIRDIQSFMSISSPNGVICHLNALVRKGWIRREPLTSRGIVIIRELP